MTQSVILGITGPSGSGKSSLVHALRQHYPKTFIHYIQMDHYYLDHSHLSIHERSLLNYDAPEAFDVALFSKHIDALKNGDAIEVPQYDFTTHSRTDQVTIIPPAPLVILDGILLLALPEIREKIQHSIFLNTPLDLCLLRRLTRDCLERKRDVESVVHQYEQTVRPMLFKYVLPSKQYATTILPRGGFDQDAIESMQTQLSQIIDEHGLTP